MPLTGKLIRALIAKDQVVVQHQSIWLSKGTDIKPLCLMNYSLKFPLQINRSVGEGPNNSSHSLIKQHRSFKLLFPIITLSIPMCSLHFLHPGPMKDTDIYSKIYIYVCT